MVAPQQGQIIRANLNPKKGHEQQGYRPMIVLSNNIVSQYSGVVLVAPISSTKRKLPLYVDLPEGLQTKGTVLLDQLVTIDYIAREAVVIEQVPDDYLDVLLDIARRILTR